MVGNARNLLIPCAGAVLLTAVAVSVRLLLDPWLQGDLPLATLYGAVAFSVWAAGYRLAVPVLVLGYLACDWLFVEPRGSFGFLQPRNLIGFVLYLINCSIIVVLGEALRAASRRAEAGRDRAAQDAAGQRASEQRFRLAAEAVNGIIYECDLRTGHVERSRGLFEVLGYHPDEVPPTGGWWVEQIHPDDRDRVVTVDPDVVRPSNAPVEYRVRHKDGRWLHVEDRAVVLRDGGGPIKLVGCTVDVTDKRQVEGQLRVSERRLRLAVEAAGTGLWTWDVATNAVAWSDEVYTILGIRIGEFDGTEAGFYRLVLLEDADRVRAALTAAVKGRTKYESEFRIVRPDGSVRWVANSGRATYDGHGRAVSVIGTIIDVTARKQAEAGLREAERRFRTMADTAPALIWQTDRGGVTFVNRHYLDFFGRPLHAVVGMGWSEFLHPEDDDYVAAYRAAFERREGYEHRCRFRRHDGAYRWLQNIGRPHLGADGEFLGFIGCSVDVTDLTAAEERARSSEERFRSLVTATAHIVWQCSAEGLVDEDCPSWRQFTGEAFERIQGLGWMDAVHPDDRERTRAAWRHALETASPYAAEYRLRRHDGAYRWMSARGVPLLNDGGGVREWIGTSADVTERREAEQQFRTLADNISQFAWMADEKGWIYWYNRRWHEYTGTTLEETAGWGWTRVHHPDHVDRVVERIRHSWDTGELWEDTFPVRGADGGYRWFLSRAVPIRDERGRVLQWFGTNTDVTEQRELADRLREADRRKDEFLATLAHELRNPLAPIRNGLQIMKMAAGDPATVERSRGMMERQVEQMSRLIDDLMDLSRISQGKIVLRRTPLRLPDALRDAIDAARPLVEERGHDLAFEEPFEPPIVDGDRTRLAQVFGNLLTNAAKYTDRGGRIRVSIERHGGDAVVGVEDNGVGIPAHMLDRVFDMFAQVERSLEKSQGGLGIGLNIVKRIVEMHGGSVAVESSGPGRGSRFTVRLPEARAATAAGRDPAEVETATPAARRRVLVVDDNADGAASLTMLLDLMGSEVRVAHDGVEAIAVAEAFGPDIILMDIGMPTLNGYDACFEIRQQPWGKDIVIVACTGWGQDEDKRKAKASGFDFHVTKPIDHAVLESILSGMRATSP